jgi:group I intron endonuclease
MTTGIYALYWEEQDLTYIGLSQDIEGRFKEHIRDMGDKTHTNYKVQNTYNLYGKPNLVIIEECLIEQLNDREIYWTKELDTLNTKHGLNIVEAGGTGFGPNASSSVYTRITILRVFSLLYRTSLSCKSIAKKTNTHFHLSKDISRGRTHKWLKEYFPAKYEEMLQKTSTRDKVPKYYKYKDITDPFGVLYKDIGNVSKFCREHAELSLDLHNSITGIGRVLDSSRKSYKGWRLAA